MAGSFLNVIGCLVVMVLQLCSMAQPSGFRVASVSSSGLIGSSSRWRCEMPAKKQSQTNARTRANDAGKPVTNNGNRAAAADAEPTDEELDRRDRMKTGPRRQAGPPLGGDTPEPAPLRELEDSQIMDPTDPEER
jgi:hypothetical protein